MPLVVSCNCRKYFRSKFTIRQLWIKEPTRSIKEHHHNNTLRTYSAYWNAFECLVDAVTIIKPITKLSKTEKQNKIDDFFKRNNGKFTSATIVECYQKIVNPGFVGRASHALKVCFPDDAEKYIYECFSRKDRCNRLYDIRNAINHGEIDAANPEELFRVETYLYRLWMIIWQMFGRIIHIPTPIDTQYKTGK